MTLRGKFSHKVDAPSGEGPILVVKLQRCPPLDEKRDQDLDAVDQSSNNRVYQFATPQLKFSTLARVALKKLAWRLEVLGRFVVLNGSIEAGSLFEGAYMPQF